MPWIRPLSENKIEMTPRHPSLFQLKMSRLKYSFQWTNKSLIQKNIFDIWYLQKKVKEDAKNQK